MSFVVIVELAIAPGKEAEAATIFAELLPETRAFDGCESVTLHEDEEGTTFVLVERWASEEAYAAYRAFREGNADPRMATLFAAPPKSRRYEDLEA